MAVFEFDQTAGSPRMLRTTNLPASSAFSFCAWVKIVDYGDGASNWGSVFSLESGGTDFIFEFFGAELYFVGTGSSRQWWNDGYTGWAFLAISCSGTTISGFYQRAGGSWTALSTDTLSSITPTIMGVGVSDAWTSSHAAQIRFRAVKIFSAALTEAELRAEMFSTRPVRHSNLTFWNSGLVPASPHVDQSGTGGNFTLTGSPGSIQDDPGVRWQRARMQLAPPAAGLNPGAGEETDTAIALGWFTPTATETDEAIALTIGAESSLIVGEGYIGEGLIGAPSAADQSVTPGVATETDAAIALGWFAPLASETDAAFAFTVTKITSLEVATETDTSLAVSVTKTVSVGVATETDAAVAATATKLVDTGQASETDTALALSAGINTGIAQETDAALAPTATKLLSVGVSAETDVSQALGWFSLRASESDTALAVAAIKLLDAGLASSTETALALAATKLASTGLASETDSGLAPTLARVLGTGVATETDTALANTVTKIVGAARAAETDQAVSLFDPTQQVNVGSGEETDTALALALTKLVSLGRADQTDVALPLAAVKTLALGLAAETDAALSISATKVVSLGRSDETDQALSASLTKTLGSGLALETDSAFSLLGLSLTPGMSAETDTAFALLLGSLFAMAPPERTATVEAESRVAVVSEESRVATVAAESRIYRA